MSTDTQATWLLVEAMGDRCTVIYEYDSPRAFQTLERARIVHARRGLADSIKELVLKMKSGDPSPKLDIYGDLRLAAEPVMGPERDPHLYAVKVWIGPIDAQVPTESRIVGTMMWDPTDKGDPITYHDPVTDGVILGYDPPATQRISAQVFRHYQYYPKEHLLGPWVEAIKDGRKPAADTFDAKIDLTRTDNQLLRVFIAMRAVKAGTSHAIRGVIHDISDVDPPTEWSGFDKQTARSAISATVGDDRTTGWGHVNFATGIVLEWYTTPPGDLRVWEFQNARWADEREYFSYLERAKNGERVSFSTVVRFNDEIPRSVKVAISPANPGDVGNGFLIVKEEDNPALEFHPMW
ncbi:GAF domain-containing protein [Gordonia sp. N1V]|uniref:GAF domain-containing protein n=1 Tax=Gordonia sp. N1V TaxID=3034163 RepID=UPI0023E2D12B|nr:GAF domain-containing protein [Gordonia sp. N1V]MDF3285046.1 DUF5593 domain-containing protein [Gordonia sp. N1V]